MREDYDAKWLYENRPIGSQITVYEFKGMYNASPVEVLVLPSYVT